MGTARAPVSESGRWPACNARVANPKVCSAPDPSEEVLGVLTVSAMIGAPVGRAFARVLPGSLRTRLQTDGHPCLSYEILRRTRAGIHVRSFAQFVARTRTI